MHFPDHREPPDGERPRGRATPPRTARPPRAGTARAALIAALVAAPSIAGAVPTCSVTVAGDILFGTYDVFSPTPLDTNVRLRINCPKGQAPMVMISKGNSTTYTPWRKLMSGANELNYNLYLDPNRQTVWGDGSEGSAYFTAPGGNAQVQIYARIPAGQDAVPGVYSDGVVVTIFL